MASLNDIMGVLQSGVAVMATLQETQAKLVPTLSSGQLAVDTLLQSGFVRVLGVSVVAGSGAAALHDAAALADAVASNAVYLVPTTPGYYATNMVFIKGVVLKIGTGTQVTLFYSRI